MPRTATTRARKPAPSKFVEHILREDFARNNVSLKVDRENGVIFRVKVLGRKSPNTHGVDGARNGTEYTLEALEDAVSRRLYEGIKVNADHPPREKPGKDRSAYDRLGKLVNVRIEEGELYADLHLLKSHPLAERLLEAAEKMPDAFGLSHNALGRGEIRNGIYQVVNIPEVRSVDVVADAGSTASLFESKEAMPQTLRQLIEFSNVKTKSELVKLLEDDMGEMPMPEPADAGAGDWKADLVAAVGKLVQSDSEEDHGMAKKILNMLKPASAAASTTEADEGDKKDDDDKEKKKDVQEGEEKDSDKKDKEAMESLKRELNELKNKDTVRELCESEQFNPSKAQFKALLNLCESDRKEFIKEQKQLLEKKPGPRSVGAHQTRELTESKDTNGAVPKDRKSFLELVRSR